MDTVKWHLYADRLKRVFDDLITCDIWRSVKGIDHVGGDTERYEKLHEGIECQVSHHPIPKESLTGTPGYTHLSSTLRVHMHPEADVRDGDILVLHMRPERQVVVSRTACYTTHTRLEVAPVDNMV